MLTDDPAAETNLREGLEEIAEGEEFEVKVDAEAAEPVRTVGAEVGAADQLPALADALAAFEAERIVLVDADDEELATAARRRFGLPVTELSAG
jgi:hypothetical protein